MIPGVPWKWREERGIDRTRCGHSGGAGSLEFLYGNRDDARQKAETALKAFEGREVEYAAGFALGLAGEAARAEAIAAKLDKDHPEDTQVQATYVPTLRALSALARNDAPKAVDLLEANRPYEFGIPPLAFNHFYGNMYPLYIRGLAYLAMHKDQEAAAEFSRLLAHPGLAAGDQRRLAIDKTGSSLDAKTCTILAECEIASEDYSPSRIVSTEGFTPRDCAQFCTQWRFVPVCFCWNAAIRKPHKY